MGDLVSPILVGRQRQVFLAIISFVGGEGSEIYRHYNIDCLFSKATWKSLAEIHRN